MDILIASDSVDELVTLRSRLAALGAGVIMAGGGEQVLEHLLHQDVDMVILNYRLPGGLSGMETGRLIRSLERCRLLPIIILTDFAHNALRSPWRAGTFDYLPKPLDVSVLAAKLEALAPVDERAVNAR